MVKAGTRVQRILDVFITNCPYLWKSPVVSQGLVRSDHLTVLVQPCISTKPTRKFVYFRDVREHCKIKMESKLNNFDWEQGIVNPEDPSESVRLFNETLLRMFNECFPPIKVEVSSHDPPYMSPLVKRLCNIRNKNMRHSNQADNFALQERINKLIRENRIRAVNNENRSKRSGFREWWNRVNKITGRKKQSTPISSMNYPIVSSIRIFNQLILIQIILHQSNC